MKECFFIILFGLVLLSGCNKDDEDLVPSGQEKNWFVIEDKPGRFNQLAYDVYEKTGICLFVNDTLGREERGVDAFGNPVVHYEMYVLGSGIFTQRDINCALSADTTAMLEAGRLINEYVIPNLPKDDEYRPKSFLLVDTIYTGDYGWSSAQGKKPNCSSEYAYWDMMGVTVGRLYDLPGYSEEEKKFWAGKVLAINILTLLQTEYTTEITEFQTISKSYYNGQYYYNMELDRKHNLYDSDCRELGFLFWKLVGQNDYATPQIDWKIAPNQNIDLTDYFAAVFTYDEVEFESKYANYPLCVSKFKIMKGIVDDFEQKYCK